MDGEPLDKAPEFFDIGIREVAAEIHEQVLSHRLPQPEVPGPPGLFLNPPGICASRCRLAGSGTVSGLPPMWCIGIFSPFSAASPGKYLIHASSTMGVRPLAILARLASLRISP